MAKVTQRISRQEPNLDLQLQLYLYWNNCLQWSAVSKTKPVGSVMQSWRHGTVFNTLRWLVQMLYHWATGDSWQLWSLNLALVTNIRHAATGMSIGGIFSTKNPSAATTKSARLESYSHRTGCKTKKDRHSHARFLPSSCERPHSLMNKPYFSRCSGKGREGEARDVRGMRAQKSWERKKRRN